MAPPMNPMDQIRALQRRRARADQTAVDDTQRLDVAPPRARGGLGRGLVVGAIFGAVVAFAVPALAGGSSTEPDAATTSSQRSQGGTDGRTPSGDVPTEPSIAAEPCAPPIPATTPGADEAAPPAPELNAAPQPCAGSSATPGAEGAPPPPACADQQPPPTPEAVPPTAVPGSGTAPAPPAAPGHNE